MPSDAARRIDALIGVCLRLARTAPSGRIVLAALGRTLAPEWIRDPDLAAELAAAADPPDPVGKREVERALRSAWGAKPSEELDELDLEPAAVTATAQVHRGILDGNPVAVKLLRPGLAAAVRQDLVLLDGVLAPLSAAFPALDAQAFVREIRERVQDELDLEHEAHTLRRFHRALRSHPFLTVPAPVTRLARDGVLVSTWIEGVPIAQAPDPNAAAARLLVFVIGSALFGVVHADPDLDDVLVQPDGRLAILDFGATRTVVPERVRSAQAALEAFAANDAKALGRHLAELGALAADEGEAALTLARDVLGELAGPGPARLDTQVVLAMNDRLGARRDELLRLALDASLAPEDLWPARGAAQLLAVIARVGASGEWLGLARAALRDGWRVSV